MYDLSFNFNYYIYVKSISPGTVMTELLLSMIERGRTEPASPSSPTRNIVAIQTEDVANAVVSILATPPNVLVSYFVVINIVTITMLNY